MPSFTPPAGDAVVLTFHPFTPPAGDAVVLNFGAETPPVGPALSAYSGTTNGSGVAAPNFTTDVAISTNGRFLPITMTVAGVSQRIVVKPT